MKVYQKLASLIGSCIYWNEKEKFDTGNNFEIEANDLCRDELPHGSGFNSGIKIDWDKTNKNKIVLQADFFHDNDDFYGWTEHQVILTPDWQGYNMRITGRDKNQIKDYIGDTLHYHLTRELPAPVAIA